MNRSRPDLKNWREFVGSAWHNDASSEWLVDDVSLPGILGQSVNAVTPDAVSIIPSNYEPRYAYPLVVWLCGKECPSHQALEHIARLSPQNYVGLAIEDAAVETRDQEAAPSDMMVDLIRQMADVESRVVNAIRVFRESVHVHSERIFLAGIGRDASTALLIAMHQPAWFAGCIAFGGQVPPLAQLFTQHRELAGKRFWLGSASNRRTVGSGDAVNHSLKTLIQSGADVTARAYPASAPITPTMLRDVDDWIISGILSNA
jgi:phospholipase/carboxylesterase